MTKIGKKIILLLSLLITFIFPAITGHSSVFDLSQREKGISAYLVPQNVEEMAQVEHVERFIVVGDDGQTITNAETAEALLEKLEKMKSERLKYGIWLVVTHPDSYSLGDNSEREALTKLSKLKGIALYICRGSELPNGWTRIA